MDHVVTAQALKSQLINGKLVRDVLVKARCNRVYIDWRFVALESMTPGDVKSAPLALYSERTGEVGDEMVSHPWPQQERGHINAGGETFCELAFFWGFLLLGG